ncbi:DUF2931 family protein [Flocculibacter collagenilyticus]|uniref:DUF2931 family protein n=1 Tax=Flocculibacter collagenilyticus TaxID=2744479 RepID=UPI0018F4673D|nr:DUF2931 family protein [Flocculibacter collagenilyticus]
MTQRLAFLLLIITSLQSLGCKSSQPVIDYMVVSASTVKGNELMVSQIKFDDQWGMPVGSLACCWQEAGASSGVYDKPFPQKVSVVWSDLDQERIYFTDVKLASNSGQLAINLPNYTWESSGKVEKKIKPYIIVGFGEHGEVKVWLSNAHSNRNKIGRVLHEIGSGQAQWNPFPEEQD